MKLPFKYIAILVIVSLAGIFAYQAYWLTGLYHTMHSEMERDITEAMRMSDYNEMMIRVDKMKQDDINHGEVSVSAGYSDDGKSFVRSSTTISREDSLDNTTLHETFMPKGDSVYVTHPNDSTRVEVSVRKNVPLLTKEDSVLFIDQHRETDKVRWMSADSARERLEEAVKDSDSSPQSALSAKGGLDVILRDQNSMLELATYFQRGLHSGLDIISDPDVLLYDSLLTSFLHDRNINLPHRLLHLHKGSKWDSTILYIDTLVNIGTPGYVPTSKAVEYNYSFDINTSQSYRLIMEPAGTLVLRQMSGILTTSFVILIVLAFSFWLLIRTILKQKTLEEMKSDFTNNITHELKTPIAVAYAANDALLNFNQAEEKAQRDKYLRICQEQLQRLSGLVEQILSMSMERRRTFRLHPEEFAIRDILETLIEQHKLKAESSVHISVDIEPEDLSVLADRTHFSNIISNLIDNAIKYSHGEAEVAIHCRKVTVEGQNEQTEISVSAHGIGIAPEKQKHIYYLTAGNFETAVSSPYLETFRRKGVEVLLMTQRIDEWMMQGMTEFEGHEFIPVTASDLKLGELADSEEEKKHEEVVRESSGLVERIKQALGDRVEGVRVSSRLVASPSCLVADADKRLTPQMRRMLEAAGQQVPEDKVTLEINPSHPLLKKAEAEKDQAGFEKWCELMLDQAALADQGTVKDPARFVKLMNELLLK